MYPQSCATNSKINFRKYTSPPKETWFLFVVTPHFSYTVTPHSHPKSSPWQPLLHFCLSKLDSRRLISASFYSVCLVTGLFNLASCLRFIHLQHVSGFPSLLRLSNIPLYVYTTFCLPIHLSLDILICFHLLDIVMNAAINSSLRHKLRNGIAGSHSDSIFNFLRSCPC